MTAIPEKHMLIVTTYAYRMERVERLLQMIDQPGEPKKFRFRQLRYTMAKTLADKVKAMAEQMLESVSVTVAESDADAVARPEPGRVRCRLPDPGDASCGRNRRTAGPASAAGGRCGRSRRGRRPSRACTSTPMSGPTGS